MIAIISYVTRSPIFSHVRPIYEQTVSEQDLSRSLHLVHRRVAHDLKYGLCIKCYNYCYYK